MTLHDFVKALIRFVGDDPDRPELALTPTRFLTSLKLALSGYKQSSDGIVAEDSLLPNFGYEEMVIIKSIPILSYCEHHIAPINGHVTIAYIPSQSIIGLSYVHKIVHMLSRKLQIQERLTIQIAELFFDAVKPTGVIVSITAKHDCIRHSMNGYSDGSTVLTSHAIGVFKDSYDLRMEFFQRGREK